MLIVKDDICIVNLEGEPHRALADRRRKVPAARDVAGLLRSIDYLGRSRAGPRPGMCPPTTRAGSPAALEQ